MAQQNVGSLIINLEARTAQIQQDMSQAKRIVGDAMGVIQKDSKRAADALEQTADAAGSLKQAGAAVAAGWALDALKDQVVEVAAALNQAQIASEKLQKTLFYANGGDIKAIGADIEWLRDLSYRLGLEIDSTGVAYARFAGAVRGTGLEAYGREIFESLSLAGSAFGLSLEESEGAMRALVQMSAKGVVMAEEFRGQLADHLPVATQAAARALGVTTGEFSRMLESGEVLADDFLPKLARELRLMSEDAATFGGESQKASAQFNSAWSDMKKEVAASGLGSFISGQLSIMADAFNDFSASVRAARAEGAGFWGQAAAGGGAVMRFLNPVNAVKYTPQSEAARADYLKKEIANKQRTLFDWSISETLPQKQASISAMSRELADIEKRTAKVGQDINSGKKQAAAAEASRKSAEARAQTYVTNGKNQTKSERQSSALAEEDAAFKAAVAGLNKGSKAYLDALSAHEARKAELVESFKKKARSGGRAAQYGSTEDREIANLKALIENEKLAAAALAEYGAEAEKLTPGQKLLNKLTQEQAVAKTAVAKAHIAAKIVLAQDLVAREQANAVAKDGLKLDREREEAAFAASVAVEDQILQLQQQAAEYGLTAAQIAENTARTWELSLAEAEKNGASAEGIDTLRQQADAYRRLADAQAGLQDKKDVETREKLAADEAKKAADEWQKSADQINQSLADALMRGFEDGKGFAESFADSLKATFKTMVLRPVIQAMMQPVSGAVNGMIYGQPGAAGSGGQQSMFTGGGFGSGAASMLASSVSGLGNFMGSATMGAYGAGMGLSASEAAAAAEAYTAAGMKDVASSITSGQQAASYAGTAATYAGYAMAAYNGFRALEDGRYGAAAGTAIGAYFGGPIGAAIGGQIGGMVDDVFGGGGGAKIGGYYGAYFDASGNTLSDIGRRYYTPDNADSTAKMVAEGVVASYRQLTELFGGTAEALSVRMGFDSDPAGDADSRVTMGLTVGGRSVGDAITRDAGRGDAALQQGLQQAGTRAVLMALQASELPKELADLLSGVDLSLADAAKLTDLDRKVGQVARLTGAFKAIGGVLPQLAALSLGAKQALADLSGGLDRFAANASGYYDAYYTDEEKRARVLADVGAQLAKANIALPHTRAEFRALAESLDLGTDAGRAMFATLMSVQGAFASVTEVTADAVAAQKSLASDLRAWLQQQQLGDSSTLDPLAKLAAAQQQLAAAVAGAQAGDAAAQQQLTRLADSVLQIGRDAYASGAQFVALEAAVRGQLTGVGTALKLPGFATGGLASGWAIVGEQGPELVNFSNPGRVYTADDTRSMMDWSRYGRQDSSALVAEVRALRDEVSRMRVENTELQQAQLQQRGQLGQMQLRQLDEQGRQAKRAAANGALS